MSYKVIVADDSQTIQKVINITLAKQPYNLIECLSEDALFTELEKNKIDLVCLDFNLSDKYSGPELAEKIKVKSPTTQILFLMGTFDTIDDATMEKCGASDKIVKPFDSNKFISLCKRLTHQEPGIANPPHETSSFDNLESQWSVNDTVEKVPPKIEDAAPASSGGDMNALDKEMNDWGMSIPGVINQSPTGPMVDLPPVIDLPESAEAEVAAETKKEEKTDVNLPSEADLEYPTAMTPSAADLEYPEIKPKVEAKEKESKLISLESYTDYPSEIEFEETYPTEETSDIDQLEEMIKDEVEADLWKVDEFEDFKTEVEQGVKDLEQTEKVFESDEDIFPRLDENDVVPELKSTPAPISAVSREEVEEMVQKYVKQYLDELFSSKIEKIAWEMIPDLAENLIRSELKKISNKVLEDQG